MLMLGFMYNFIIIWLPQNISIGDEEKKKILRVLLSLLLFSFINAGRFDTGLASYSNG